MNKVLLFILSLSTVSSFSQEYKIIGRVVDGKTLDSFEAIDVGFDKDCKTKTTASGLFELTITDKQLMDTLIIDWLHYYQLRIINFPPDKIIDLGTIPLYEYYMEYPLVSFDCGPLNFRCNHRRKKFWNEENKKRTDYFDKMHLIIGHYRLVFKGKWYAISVDKHLIDLSKPSEE